MPQNYEKYLQSSRWKRLRETVEKKCAACGLEPPRVQIQVHHRTYENLGTPQEQFDLLPLCSFCHRSLHQMQKHKGLSLSEALDIWLEVGQYFQPKRIKSIKKRSEKKERWQQRRLQRYGIPPDETREYRVQREKTEGVTHSWVVPTTT